jgi:hypothetical protein
MQWRTPRALIPLQFIASTCIAQNAWRATPRIRAHADAKAGAPPAAPFLSLTALLTTQFRPIFRCLRASFLPTR